MDSSSNFCILHSFPLFLVIILFSVLTFQENHVNAFINDNQKLIFHQCSNQTNSPINPSYDSFLSSLFQEFIAKSSKFKYYKTIVGDETSAISGTFQCRNDLSPDECQTCVSQFPDFSNHLCGKSIPARIQLAGCYTHYYQEENNEENTYDSNEPLDQVVLHKSCSKYKVRRNEFEEVKYAAFAALERCVVVSENGFCEVVYESVRVVVQCVGSLWRCGCGECASDAIRAVEEDEMCRYSVLGEVYMEGCFVRYTYGDGEHYHGFGGYSFDEDNRETSPKKIAIVIGGLVALALGMGLCYFMRSCGKKKDDW